MRLRTGYSFKTAYGKLEPVIERLKAIGSAYAPISDRLSTFGFNRWTKLAEAAGLKPLYGVELAVVPELGLLKPPIDFWTFFATDSLRPLHDAIWQATSNPGKEPQLTYSQALSYDELIKISGERVLLDFLLGQMPDAISKFHFGLSPSVPLGLIKRAQTRCCKIVATSDNYYPTAADEDLYRIALGWRSGSQTYPRHILADQEWFDFMAGRGLPTKLLDDALAEKYHLLGLPTATLRKGRLLAPARPGTLREICEAAAPRLGVDLSSKVYSDRLTRELDLISEKEFEDYFYIISDLVKWAKQRMVVGPARGSSCGSLVCYLLEITTIDPIPYNLLFERFIDVNRKDLPDIDIDFSDVNRHKVFEYAEARYGRDRVARLGTVGMFAARSALKQAGASLHIPGWRTDKVADSIIVRSSGDSRVMNTLEDTLTGTDAGKAILVEYPHLIVVTEMEGHPQLASQHAAGLVITDTPVRDYVAMDARTGGAWLDKKDAEDLDILKIDALGLTQLSVFERTLQLIGQRPTNGYLEALPLDDQQAFDVLNKGHYSGIFQFTGQAVRSLSGQIHFKSIDDFIAMTALARPGPLASGGASAWIKRRNGEKIPKLAHPLLDQLTKDTYGVVMYQEQVMMITRQIGLFSWADTAQIRKLMSSRMGNERFEAFWKKFRAGAIENGMEEEAARALWAQINSFGAWAFNKSHAVAYGILSYYCCYLKAHFPTEFAAATLDAEPDPHKQLALLRELDAEGVTYVAVDPDASVDRWTVTTRPDGGKTLVGPLTAIKGIGPKKMLEIMEARRQGLELKPAILASLQNAKTEIDDLYPIKAEIERLHPDLTAINIYTKPTPIINIRAGEEGSRGDLVILGRIKKIAPRDENEEINLAKRGGRRVYGPSNSLNLWLYDDSDEIYVKIDRFNYERMGRKIVEEGKTGKTLLAIKGTCPDKFRMITAKLIKWL